MTKAAFFLAVLAVAAAVPDAARAQAFSDEEFCRVLTEEADTVNRRNPSWIDPHIRNDGMAVLCLQKTVEYRVYIKTDPVNLTADWQRRRQAYWSRQSCREPLLTAIRNGWQIVEILRLPKGDRYPEGRRHRVVAACG